MPFGYHAQKTERKRSHCLYLDDLKLLGRNDDGLGNEIKIVIAISNMNFGLENCAIICLKNGSKIYIYIGSTSEKYIKEMDLTEAC